MRDQCVRVITYPCDQWVLQSVRYVRVRFSPSVWAIWCSNLLNLERKNDAMHMSLFVGAINVFWAIRVTVHPCDCSVWLFVRAISVLCAIRVTTYPHTSWSHGWTVARSALRTYHRSHWSHWWTVRPSPSHASHKQIARISGHTTRLTRIARIAHTTNRTDTYRTDE
jgi:hypothetical protein